MNITIETIINAPINKVWQFWNEPSHVTQWNAASEDWHTIKAENNLTEGGRFSYRMEAKDGSFGFDFSGTYDIIDDLSRIEYTLDDNRKVTIHFSSTNDQTHIIETFEAEDENPIAMQQQGWQMILNNFKQYVEQQ